MRVLVCGGRDYNNRAVLFGTLDDLGAKRGLTEILNGGGTGADAMARDWAQRRAVPYITLPADWQRYRKAAGPLRNQRMLDEYSPRLVIAFPGGRGTQDMIDRALLAGLEVIEVKA